MNNRLDIRLEGKRIDLPSGLSITLERFNPFFSYDTVQGSRVMPFTLPLSETNDRFFNWYYQLQAAYPDKPLHCLKYADGVLIERGMVQLELANDTGYSIFYTQNLGEIFGDYQNTPLNLLPLGSEPRPASFSLAADAATSRYCLPTIENPGWYAQTAVSGYTGRVNDTSAGAYMSDTPKVPMLFLGFVLQKCAELCDFRIEGEFLQHAAWSRLVVYNTFAVDADTTITYANHLPEITIPELLKELRKLFNLYLAFDVQNRVLTIRFCDDLISRQTVLNWTDRSAANHVKAPNLPNRLELDWELDSGDGIMKTVPADLDKYQSPTPAGGLLYPIKTKFSTLDFNPVSGLATCNQPGVTDTNNQGNNRFTARLLFWNGLIGGRPTATNQYGLYRLAWHGTNNLVQTCWRKTEAWRASTYRLTKRVNLSPADLAKIDFHLSKGEYMKVHIKGVDYLIESIRVNLPVTNQAEVVLWRA